MVEAFKMLHYSVQAISVSKRMQKKEDEVTINWNSSVQKRAILKDCILKRITSTAKTYFVQDGWTG
jgi:hypothetical protein